MKLIKVQVLSWALKFYKVNEVFIINNINFKCDFERYTNILRMSNPNLSREEIMDNVMQDVQTIDLNYPIKLETMLILS